MPMSVIGHDLECKQSSIPEAGGGVFAKRAYKKHELVTFYDGELVTLCAFTESHSQRKRCRKYTHFKYIDGTGFYYIDGVKSTNKCLTGRGAGSLINSSRHPNTRYVVNHTKMRPMRQQGTQDFLMVPSVNFVATKNIEPGDELFWNYACIDWQCNRILWHRLVEHLRTLQTHQAICGESRIRSKVDKHLFFAHRRDCTQKKTHHVHNKKIIDNQKNILCRLCVTVARQGRTQAWLYAKGYLHKIYNQIQARVGTH